MAFCSLSLLSVLVGLSPGFDSTSPAQERSKITTGTMTGSLREPDNPILIYNHLDVLASDTA